MGRSESSGTGSPPRPVNAVLFIVDSLRRDALGTYAGTSAQSPALDRLAARGAAFDNAYIGSFPCIPARREIWTGRYEFPWRGWGPLEEGEPTLPRLLSDASVVTQLITDHYHYWERGAGNYHFDFDGADFIRGQENDHWFASGAWETEYPAERGKVAGHARFPDSWERYRHNVAERREEADYFAPQVMRRAIEWLRREAGRAPFFLLIDSFDPHEPFDPPTTDADAGTSDPGGARGNPWPTYGPSDQFTAAEIEATRGLYAAEVAMVDRWLGRVVETLEQTGVADTTLVMVISDHGFLFGEHGLIGKPWTGVGDGSLYDELARIPFIVVDPSRPGRLRPPQLVQPIDVMPTMLEWFGVKPPRDLHGSSVLPLLGGDPGAWREYAFYGRFGESVNVTDGRWTLMRWPPAGTNAPLYWYSTNPPTFIGARAAGGLEPGPRYPAVAARGEQRTALYDREADPEMRVNQLAAHPDQADRLEAAITALLDRVQAPPEQFERLGLRRPIPDDDPSRP